MRIVCSTAVVLSLAAAVAARPLPETPPTGDQVAGVVLDTSGGVVPGAAVVLRCPGRPPRETSTNSVGRFAFSSVPAARATVVITMEGFSPVVVKIDDAGSRIVRAVLRPLGVSEQVTVRSDARPAGRISMATRTETPLRNVPQAVSVVTRDTIAAQAMQGLADVVRYVPGVVMAQGEGNRDAAIFRGNASTADFFIDGVRDDVQYFRDLYNVERVEAVKGPNAMIFGRGGAGGVLNRVTRQANWSPTREATLQVGSFGARRASLDAGHAFNRGVAARVTAVYENSDSYRGGVGVERYGLNPTVAAAVGHTVVTAGYERFHDSRTADRGIPSFNGAPVSVAPSTFFGDPAASHAAATVNAVSIGIDHRFPSGIALRNRTRYADYDKFYQNVFPGAVDATGTRVSLSAYNHATTRRNTFNQTDVTGVIRTGRVSHHLLVGAEIGRQVTGNVRHTGYFGGGAGTGATTVSVPLAAPSVSLPLTFGQGATDAGNRSVATTTAVYAQDQAQVLRPVQVVAGLRYEVLDVDFRNDRTGGTLREVDRLVSPRIGLVYTPVAPVSIYTSYTLAYLPRAGEQLSSLSVTNRALEPEQYRNYEVGAKWDLMPRLSFSAALYRLDRRNIAVPDPVDPLRAQLVDGQRSSGLELEANGHVTSNWTIVAAYAHQRGTITRSLSATARAGARLAQLPAHTLAVWNRYDFSRTVGAGLGVVSRSAMFTSTDNTVGLSGFARLDAAVFVTFRRGLRGQVNLENVLNRRYFACAHSNNNITPGSPRAVRVTLTAGF